MDIKFTNCIQHTYLVKKIISFLLFYFFYYLLFYLFKEYILSIALRLLNTANILWIPAETVQFLTWSPDIIVVGNR